REGRGRKPEMNEDGKSDSPVVPTKPPNKAVAAEAVEGREAGQGEHGRRRTYRTQGRASVSPGLCRVREAAERDREARFTALLHHITVESLREAYRALRPRSAAGVDGVTWEAYGEDLEASLQDLHRRLHSGAYRAKPVRRVYIPKADGRQRPLGIASLEDKIVQGAVVGVLRWRNAGVGENGTWAEGDEGTPQGATVSPLLANVYLHYVFDQWANQWRKRQARGDMIIVRYADDFIVGFEHKEEAEQFLADLSERLAMFELELKAGKTRLVQFGRFAAQKREKWGPGKPETFDFLGFTHVCGDTREGRFQVTRITVSKRMRSKLRELKEEIKQRRHLPIPEQGSWLRSVVQGHLAYYAVPGNLHRVEAFKQQVKRHWAKALRRRSQKTGLTWAG